MLNHFVFFFFNDTATTEIYTLSLHDALPICFPRPMTPVLPRRRPFISSGALRREPRWSRRWASLPLAWRRDLIFRDRKSTRLNSSHTVISYAVFCLKKK